MSSDTTQVKYTIESDIVATFKARCATEGVSMTSVIRHWMKTCHPSSEPKYDMLTRTQRRKVVQWMIKTLNDLIKFEGVYRDNIPDAFEQRCEVAEHACERFEEALECLEDAYF